jgi:hypothetical protein
VVERVLVLALERALRHPPDELAADRLLQRPDHHVYGQDRDRLDRARPEHLADDRGVAKDLALGRRQRVDPPADQHLQGLRHRQLGRLHRALADEALIAEHPDELLHVQGVPTAALDQRGLRLGGQDGALQQGADQHRRLLCGQGN